jgi:hypothetical protein
MRQGGPSPISIPSTYPSQISITDISTHSRHFPDNRSSTSYNLSSSNFTS